MKVYELTERLLERYPLADAESWDQNGLLAGNPLQEITGVAVALDATAETIKLAYEAGANVLVTHHPLALKGPVRIGPALYQQSIREIDLTSAAAEEREAHGDPALRSQGFTLGDTVAVAHFTQCAHPGAAYWAAAEHNVAVISMHTNLDRSPFAQTVFPNYFGLTYEGPLECPENAPSTGRLGQVCTASRDLTLYELCTEIYQKVRRRPRVWGDPTRRIGKIAISSGAGGSLINDVIAQGCEVLITGECSYHTCVEIESNNVALILLGHDVSELPYVTFLTEELTQLGLDSSLLRPINEPVRWWTV